MGAEPSAGSTGSARRSRVRRCEAAGGETADLAASLSRAYGGGMSYGRVVGHRRVTRERGPSPAEGARREPPACSRLPQSPCGFDSATPRRRLC